MREDVRELRLVITAPDYEVALRFYRDVLGLRQVAALPSDGGRVVLLAAGRATIELADEGHAAYIDDLEVGAGSPGPSGSRSRSQTPPPRPRRCARRGRQSWRNLCGRPGDR